jgi:hypothetical protein
MFSVRFEPTITVFEWAKTFHASDRTTILIGYEKLVVYKAHASLLSLHIKKWQWAWLTLDRLQLVPSVDSTAVVSNPVRDLPDGDVLVGSRVLPATVPTLSGEGGCCSPDRSDG